MKNRSRIFICGITSNEYEKISDLILKTKDYVDGYVWCVDSNPNSDSTYQLLEDNKKEGKIVRHRWWNNHSAQMNEFLHCGLLQPGDYYWIFDSSECPTENWLTQVKYNIAAMKQNNIGIIGCSGRAYLAEFQDTNLFEKSPHWFLTGNYKRTISISEDKKDEFIINKRKLNPSKHFQEHDTKYYLYPFSNQIEAFYGKYGQSVVNFHEQKRLEFRKYLREKTGLEPGLKALDELFLLGEGEKFTEYEIEMIELEFCLSEYFQRIVLKMDFMTTMHPRERWSFKNYLLTGDGWSDKNYRGTRLKYQENLENP